MVGGGGEGEGGGERGGGEGGEGGGGGGVERAIFVAVICPVRSNLGERGSWLYIVHS